MNWFRLPWLEKEKKGINYIKREADSKQNQSDRTLKCETYQRADNCSRWGTVVWPSLQCNLSSINCYWMKKNPTISLLILWFMKDHTQGLKIGNYSIPHPAGAVIISLAAADLMISHRAPTPCHAFTQHGDKWQGDIIRWHFCDGLSLKISPERSWR